MSAVHKGDEEVPDKDEEAVGLLAASATPMVEVVAPSTLPEGYEFEVHVDNTVVSVTVPKGGITEGQRFMVPVPSKEAGAKSSIPVGRWKDGLFNCFTHGCCHPQLCLSWWCLPLAIGQILQRMKLKWNGIRGGVTETAGTFKKLVIITIVFFFLIVVLNELKVVYMGKPIGFTNGRPVYDTSSTPYLVCVLVDSLVRLSMAMYLLVVVTNARGYIRHKYSIPGDACCDCCTSLWCTCCVVSQMARHTADYDSYTAACCTGNGLPLDAPSPVE